MKKIINYIDSESFFEDLEKVQSWSGKIFLGFCLTVFTYVMANVVMWGK